MRFKTIPILGLKSDVPVDDTGLLKMVGNDTALTHDVDGVNISYERKTNSCTKSFGNTVWNNTGFGTAKTYGLFELDDGTNLNHIVFSNGKAFYFDGSDDPVQIKNISIEYSSLSGAVVAGETVTGDTTATVATVVTGISAASGTLYISDVTGGTGDFSATESLTFSGADTANCDSVIETNALRTSGADVYTMMKYGSYMVFADFGGMTPQKWSDGDANLTNLITGTSAILYKFRYVIEWYLHIIGLYSDQTNGNIDIRWTDALPGATVTFPAANQIYKPGNDQIVGASKLGANTLLVYGTDSIAKLDYYPSSTPVFGITTLIDKGAVCNACIINDYGANWFFNKEYGFVRYTGGSRIAASDIISKDIESLISEIDSRYYKTIIGTSIPRTRQLVWGIPDAGLPYPTRYLFYDIDTQIWTREAPMYFNQLDAWKTTTDGFQGLVFCGSVGTDDIHTHTGESYAYGSGAISLNGYRVEPAMHFGEPTKKKFLKELWFGIVDGGAYYLDVFYRNGETAKEVEGASWQFIGSLSLDDPDPPVVYMPSLVSSIGYDNLSGGTFSIGDTITGATNAYTATILCDVPTSATEGTLYLSTLTGALENNEEIATNGVTADCTGASVDVTINPTARLHQIKWGTDQDNEKFSINRIDYVYETGGDY